LLIHKHYNASESLVVAKKLKQLQELLLLLQDNHMLFHFLAHHTATSNLMTKRFITMLIHS
jgi:hypothetical protein